MTVLRNLVILKLLEDYLDRDHDVPGLLVWLARSRDPTKREHAAQPLNVEIDRPDECYHSHVNLSL